MPCVYFLCNFVVEEIPKYGSMDRKSVYNKSKPHFPPGYDESEKHRELFKFCKKVKFILQTVSSNEYQAAITYMKPPPFYDYKNSVIFPSPGSVVGMFAGHEAALIRTDLGDNAAPFIEQAIKTFPNASFIIGVGVGFSLCGSQHKLGDVLVSKQVSNMVNFQVKLDGMILRRRVIDVSKTLVALFCRDLTYDDDFELTKEPDLETGEVRTAQVFAGRFVSYPKAMDSPEMRSKARDAYPDAIGGEWGGELLKFHKNRSLSDGVIMVKGIIDSGDGVEDSWQFTAALAALAYIETKLYYY